MNSRNPIKYFIRGSIRRRLKENSLENILWIINIVPNIAGFSLHNEKISAPFWILHLSLLFYVYGVGSLVYQVKHATGAEDFIKSYVNISLLILILNISWWWLKKRPLLMATLKLIKESDKQTQSTESLRKKHKKLLSTIKIIILIFYGSNYFDAAFIYLPHRVNVVGDYSMTPCVGLEPLTSSPNREICLTILCVQEFTIMMCVLNYQVLLLLLIAHTSAMYQMLSHEIMEFNDFTDVEENKAFVKERLPSLIRRHILILSAFDKLKSLYSVPIGIDFGSNAICMSLFFYLPLQEWLAFIPVLIYCFLVFFLYCFLCQRLTNASEAFETAVYSCGWENFSLKEKKLVYVMLRQAQKPVVLLAADIIPVNMYTFASTLQAMFKFVTVVKF